MLLSKCNETEVLPKMWKTASVLGLIKKGAKSDPLNFLLETFDTIFNLISDGAPVDLFYFDFSKAFDTVPHYRLLSKTCTRNTIAVPHRPSDGSNFGTKRVAPRDGSY